MIRSPYYTFRRVTHSPVRFECCKWNDYEMKPIEVYIVNMDRRSCTCRAAAECKHIRLVDEIMDSDVSNEMFRWAWDEKNEWTHLNDIPTVEEMLSA